MKTLYPILIFFISIIQFSACHSQTETKTYSNVGGSCEGCEAVLEFGNKALSNIDTFPKFQEINPKIKITGTVFQKDGKTPAEDIIIYMYHTNRGGIYEQIGETIGWGKRHGSFRGWVKTRKDGKYTIYTFRPGAYPNRGAPEHIHITVKEPDKNEYYIDDILFEDDALLTIVREEIRL